jgi:hypothetical protein
MKRGFSDRIVSAFKASWWGSFAATERRHPRPLGHRICGCDSKSRTTAIIIAKTIEGVSAAMCETFAIDHDHSAVADSRRIEPRHDDFSKVAILGKRVRPQDDGKLCVPLDSGNAAARIGLIHSYLAIAALAQVPGIPYLLLSCVIWACTDLTKTVVTG